MKKKILFFITSLAGGGAEKVLVNMVNNLDVCKYDITVKVIFDGGINRQYLSDKVKYEYVFKKTFRGISKLLLLFSPKKLFDFFIGENYDIVVSYFQGPTTRIVAGCNNKSTKIVQWIHNEFHEKRKVAGCYRSIKECIFLQLRLDANVYVAQTVKDIYLSSFPELRKQNNVVLYNAVETNFIQRLSNEQIEDENSLFDNDFTLITVGRLVQQKSFDRLLRVFERLYHNNQKLKLIILGTGELEQALKKQCYELRIEGGVVFLGYTTNPYKYVRRSDLFVCSSLHEGFSTAVTESLIVGTPVITTECSGMKELLGDSEYGLIVNNDEESLYQGLKSLIEDKERLDSYRLKASYCGEKFDLTTRISQIEGFFDSL